MESHNGNADFASLPERALRLFPVGFNTPETRPDCFALEAVRTDAKTLLDALTADGNVLRVKGYIRAADGVRFVSDTGQGFETMESPHDHLYAGNRRSRPRRIARGGHRLNQHNL